MRALLIPLVFILMAFSVDDFGDRIEDMYRDYAAQMPKGNRIYVCVNDCMDDPRFFTYSRKDLAFLKTLMNSGSPKRERENIARSVKWFENRIGSPSNSCTGEALNVTSHLLILHKHKMLRFHRPHKPMGKRCFMRWPHFAGMVRANDKAATVWAVDSYLDKNRTLVQPFSTWYCK